MPQQGNSTTRVLETDRLFLRRLSTNDVAFIVELLNEPSFIRNIGDKGVRTTADASKYLLTGPIASYEQFGFGLYLAELRDSGIPIGICGLLKRESLDDADIGFAFLERFWGHGYAFEAASAVMDYGRRLLRLPRIVAITAPDNQASIKVLEKICLRFEKMISLPGYKEDSMLFTSEWAIQESEDGGLIQT